MTKLFKVLSVATGVATFALAVSVQAEPAQVTETGALRINVSDLDLSSDAGRAAFEARVHKAARALCDQADLFQAAACRRTVRDEAWANLEEQQAQIDHARPMKVAATGRR